MTATDAIPTAEPQIRAATNVDAELLHSILIQAFIEYEGQLDPPSGVYAETAASLLSKLHEGGAFLCEVGAVAAGCVFYAPKATYLYIGRLAVIPTYRRWGIGRLLLNGAEQHAREQGFAHVRLSVRLVLTPLRAYYTAFGYVPIAFHSHAGYSEATYVEMEKRVI